MPRVKIQLEQLSCSIPIRQELKFLAHSESGLKPTPEPVLTGFRYEAGISIPDGLGSTAAIPRVKMQHIFEQLSCRTPIRQELKFLAHSERHYPPTRPINSKTAFRIVKRISNQIMDVRILLC